MSDAARIKINLFDALQCFALISARQRFRIRQFRLFI